jgi:DNA-binding transcriptional ArsR family regulator
MNTLIVTTLVAAAAIGALAFAVEDPLKIRAPSCDGDPIASLARGSPGYPIRLTLQDNVTGSNIRTCLYDIQGTKIFDQTYAVEGETGWMRDIILPAKPDVFLVDSDRDDAQALPELRTYLDSSSCKGVVPEFFASRAWHTVMVDCDLPSQYFPPGMPRQYAEEAALDRQGFAAPDGRLLNGGPGAAVAVALAVTALGVWTSRPIREWLRWTSVSLFTRIIRPRVLDQRVRQEIHQLVAQDPGIQRAEIARQLELGASQTLHHLRVLVREEVVSELRMGGGRHYLLRGRFSPTDGRRIVALRSPGAAEIVQAIRERPGCTLSRLALVANRTKPAASKAVRRLRQAGVLRVERHGRHIRIFADA